MAVIVRMGLGAGMVVGVAVGVGVMPLLVTPLAVLSQSAALTPRPPHRPCVREKRSEGYPWALYIACPGAHPLLSSMLMHRLSQRP